MAQLIECQTRKPEVQTPSGAKEQFVRVFPSQTCFADSFLVCPTPVCVPRISHSRPENKEKPLMMHTKVYGKIMSWSVRPPIFTNVLIVFCMLAFIDKVALFSQISVNLRLLHKGFI